MELILASKSPRRQELLRAMGFEFRVLTADTEENYPPTLEPKEVPAYLARKKALALEVDGTDQLLIGADTIVLLEGRILGKPRDREDAFAMLKDLSGKAHEVITGVALRRSGQVHVFSDTTKVFFAPLTGNEIEYYITHFQPFDKAGSYGIQEWIGYNKIERIEGSYTNVVGLPTEMLYRELLSFQASSSGLR